MKRLLFVLTIALVALSLNSAPVAAQAVGVTDVDITIDGIVILHYFTDVDVTITGDVMGALINGGSSIVDEGVGSATPGGMGFDLAIPHTALAGGAINAIVMTLQNAWAVRSIGGVTGETTVGIAVTNPTLTHSGGGTEDIEITDATVSVDTGTPGALINFPSPGLVDPQDGDVQLTLNLTNATLAGEYINGVFTLTANVI